VAGTSVVILANASWPFAKVEGEAGISELIETGKGTFSAATEGDTMVGRLVL
jgi:hypothetical protein